jgi:hypothetical protein
MGEAAGRADDRHVAHLATTLSATVVFYAGVTRGALVVARTLEYLVRR